MLDGAILVLCSVGGVQSQSITVDQQMKRYQVPWIAFINKCDRSGRQSLPGDRSAPIQAGAQCRGHADAHGPGEDFQGVIDLVSMKALYFDGENGETVRVEEIPAAYRDEAKTKRLETRSRRHPCSPMS